MLLHKTFDLILSVAIYRTRLLLHYQAPTVSGAHITAPLALDDPTLALLLSLYIRKLKPRNTEELQHKAHSLGHLLAKCKLL